MNPTHPAVSITLSFTPIVTIRVPNDPWYSKGAPEDHFLPRPFQYGYVRTRSLPYLLLNPQSQYLDPGELFTLKRHRLS